MLATLERSPKYYSQVDEIKSSVFEPTFTPISMAYFGALAASLATATLQTSDEPEISRATTKVQTATTEQIRIALSSSFWQANLRFQTVQDALIQRIRELGTYSKGWHNEDSEPASARAIEESERFVRSIEWEALEAPIVALTEDGEINLLWSDSNKHVDIGFFGDGNYVFYARSGDGPALFEDGAPWNRPLPEEVINMITKARRA